MTKLEAGKLVAMIAEMWAVPAWTEEQILLWAELLCDLDFDTTARAVKAMMQSQDARPTVAQIRREVAKAQQPKGLFMPPDEAWAYVSQCFGTVGQYREFPDLHPLVKRVVDGIGWQEMCRSDNIDVIRGQFRMAYQALLERSVVETATSEGAAMLPTAAVPALERRPALLS